MDREPEKLQFLGLFGIYKEAFKIIFSWPKIFINITLSLILPLTFILLAHIQLCDLLFSKIINKHRLLDPILSEWIYLFLFEAAYLVFLIIFSLLSTSTGVYSIASIYTTKELTFKKAMTVFPKVWKRLMATFLWGFSFIILYNVTVVAFLVLTYIPFGFGPLETIMRTADFAFTLLLHYNGVVYINIVWQLASVMSVLEDFEGTQAMKKSKALIEGKEGVAYTITLMLLFADILIQYGFDKMVLHGEKLGTGRRVLGGIVCFLLLMLLILFGLVVQSVFYFVCKSYHNERIDESLLADHLKVFETSATLNGEFIQLEKCDV